MKSRNLVKLIGGGLAALFFAAPVFAGPHFAVWLDGAVGVSNPNAILSRLNTLFGPGSAVLVSTINLETPGFLSAFDTVVVSRNDAQFGQPLSAAAAANIRTYVGINGSPGQGGVVLFTNDMADNLAGSASGDPFDPNLDRLFVNAATAVSATHHGYIGEFNGAVMGVASNSAGFPALDLLLGNAGAVSGTPAPFTYGVGPIGSGNPIDAGVTFPFTDADQSTFLTRIAGALPGNIVDIYINAPEVGINGLPAVLANAGGGVGAPEPASLALLGIAAAAMFGVRRRIKQ